MSMSAMVDVRTVKACTVDQQSRLQRITGPIIEVEGRGYGLGVTKGVIST